MKAATMTLADVRRTFDEWAPIYNPTHAWIPGRREARLALGVRPGDRVLDLACGTGLNFPHLRSLVGPKGRVVGVDLSPRMLEVARRQIAKRGWDNVQAREGDAAHLPFPDGSFDHVLCSYALNIIPEYRQAIGEIRRLLVRGGTFVSLEMRPSSHSLAPVARICAVDMNHDSIGEIRQVFGDVQVRRRWMGMIMIVAAVNAD